MGACRRTRRSGWHGGRWAGLLTMARLPCRRPRCSSLPRTRNTPGQQAKAIQLRTLPRYPASGTQRRDSRNWSNWRAVLPSIAGHADTHAKLHYGRQTPRVTNSWRQSSTLCRSQRHIKISQFPLRTALLRSEMAAANSPNQHTGSRELQSPECIIGSWR